MSQVVILFATFNQTSSHRTGLDSTIAKDIAAWTKKISTTSGRGRSHSAQDNANLPQGLLPRRHGRGWSSSQCDILIIWFT